MNIIDKYILQKKSLVVVFSSIDIELLKEVVGNLAKDFNATVIDIIEEMKTDDISKIDKSRVEEKLKSERAVNFVMTPYFPNETFKARVSYHINLSLNWQLINKKNIDKSLVNVNNSISKNVRINKFINVHKFESTKKMEDYIFELLINWIQSKLDDGKYFERIKTMSESESTTSSDNETSTSSKDESTSDNETSTSSESETTSNNETTSSDDGSTSDQSTSSDAEMSDDESTSDDTSSDAEMSDDESTSDDTSNDAEMSDDESTSDDETSSDMDSSSDKAESGDSQSEEIEDLSGFGNDDSLQYTIRSSSTGSLYYSSDQDVKRGKIIDDQITDDILDRMGEEEDEEDFDDARVDVEDVNMDNDMIPVRNFSNEDAFYDNYETDKIYNGGGSRKIKKTFNLKKYNNIHTRKIRKRL